MSVRVAPKTEAVLRCIPRHDGGYLIVTKKGSAVSPVEIEAGAHVVIADGKAERV